MSSLEELRRENDRLKALLDGGIREQLMAYRGVYHVAVGVKETAGDLTGDLSFRVYVREKIEESQLPAERVVPRKIGGVKTDINTPPLRIPIMADEKKYRPIVGGIRITNGRTIVDGPGYGTLGCIGKNRRDKSIVALTNWHVLFVGGGGIGTEVHQPTEAHGEGNGVPTGKNVIGVVGDGIITAIADAAVVKVDTSWCRTCGIDWRDEIHGLGVNRYDGISGIAHAVSTEPVFVVGQSTGHLVEGIVVTDDEAEFGITYEHVSDPRVPAPGGKFTQRFIHQLSIRPAGNDPFSLPGDSGGVVVNARSEIVGLLFSHDFPPKNTSSANHISDVIKALHVRKVDFDPNFTSIPPPSSPHRTARTLSVPQQPRPDTSAVWTAARRHLQGSPLGARVSAAIEAHRREAVELVNSCRPVTVAWRRHQGPAFVAHLLKSIREPGHRIPDEVDGVTLDGLVEHMTETFARHGSPELRAAIKADGDCVRKAASACRSFDEFAARLGEIAE
jgi:hypothetical protein